MTEKVKRGILELNKFQLRVLKPFYVACLLTVVFFVAMCYAIFFFPQSSTVESILLTECPGRNSLFLILANAGAVVLSLIAIVLVNHQVKDSFPAVGADVSSGKIIVKKEKVILPSVLAGLALFFSVGVAFLFAYQYFGMRDYAPDSRITGQSIDPQKILIILAGMAVIFAIFVLFYWAYKISNKVLGPYERVLRDLDKVIDGRSGKALTVRQGDDMFAELIARINVLIKQRKP